MYNFTKIKMRFFTEKSTSQQTSVSECMKKIEDLKKEMETKDKEVDRLKKDMESKEKEVEKLKKQVENVNKLEQDKNKLLKEVNTKYPKLLVSEIGVKKCKLKRCPYTQVGDKAKKIGELEKKLKESEDKLKRTEKQLLTRKEKMTKLEKEVS